MKGLIVATGEFVDIGSAHPVADLFPMLAGDDLEELVASIYEQGLLQPVVLDAEGRVLDGRNRLTACERLDVIPEVLVYDGEDPDAYALTVNLARRHLSKGQRAMLAVRAVLVSGTRQADAARAIEASQQRISQANVVLDHAPDLADAVIAGGRSLDDAYKVAQANKKAATDEAAQMAKLYAKAPDLADHVADEQDPMTLPEAMAAYERRTKLEEDRCRRFTAGISEALVRLPALLDPKPEEMIQTSWRPQANPHAQTPGLDAHFSPDGIRGTAHLLLRIASHLEEQGGSLL